ncbi:unnamed protein product, partial [Medioppia subpectinata]
RRRLRRKTNRTTNTVSTEPQPPAQPIQSSVQTTAPYPRQPQPDHINSANFAPYNPNVVNTAPPFPYMGIPYGPMGPMDPRFAAFGQFGGPRPQGFPGFAPNFYPQNFSMPFGPRPTAYPTASDAPPAYTPTDESPHNSFAPIIGADSLPYQTVPVVSSDPIVTIISPDEPTTSDPNRLGEQHIYTGYLNNKVYCKLTMHQKWADLNMVPDGRTKPRPEWINPSNVDKSKYGYKKRTDYKIQDSTCFSDAGCPGFNSKYSGYETHHNLDSWEIFFSNTNNRYNGFWYWACIFILIPIIA